MGGLLSRLAVSVMTLFGFAPKARIAVESSPHGDAATSPCAPENDQVITQDSCVVC